MSYAQMRQSHYGLTMTCFVLLTLLLFCCALRADTLATPAAAPTTPATPATPAGAAALDGYDFEQVVTRLEHSVDPLQKVMSGSFQSFSQAVERAAELADGGRTDEAVELCRRAIAEVLARRDEVLKPMWDGQSYLTEQIARVRARLAQAVAAGAEKPGELAALDQRTETLLDGIARRVADESDPLRKKRLIAHYRAIRQLARIKAMRQRLSPDQRTLWQKVLGVLDETALAHQQVLMGTEVLFSQFEATAANLEEYRQLLQTFDGVNRLTGAARSLDGKGAGLDGLAEGMNELQRRLGGFNQQIEQALRQRMGELEQQVNEITSAGTDGSSAVMPAQADDELIERINRLQGSAAQ